MLPTQEIALSELLEGRSRSILRNKISDVLLFFVITSVVLGSLLLGAYAVTGRVRGEDLWHRIVSLVSLGGHFWGAQRAHVGRLLPSSSVSASCIGCVLRL
jgi:hypothetical protein